MRNRLKFLGGCVLCLPLVLVSGAAMADRFGNPKLTETELFNRWAPFVLFAAVPAFGGYMLASEAFEDESGEE